MKRLSNLTAISIVILGSVSMMGCVTENDSKPGDMEKGASGDLVPEADLGTAAQALTIGPHRFRVRHTSYCLDVCSTASGAPVHQAPCNGSALNENNSQAFMRDESNGILKFVHLARARYEAYRRRRAARPWTIKARLIGK